MDAGLARTLKARELVILCRDPGEPPPPPPQPRQEFSQQIFAWGKQVTEVGEIETEKPAVAVPSGSIITELDGTWR